MFIHEFFILLTIAPILLIPIEIFIPYPYIVEEIVKFIFIFGFFKVINKKISVPIWGGFLFALTETFLYVPNIINSGQPILFFERLLFTGTMHITTMILIFAGVKRGKIYGCLALLGAILIHKSYNYLIISI